MKLVIQRVASGGISIDGGEKQDINAGLVVLVGIASDDNEDDIRYLAKKVVNMRIFSDNDGKMNLSVKDVDGDILLVSQFTLFADTKKGNRPYFEAAAKPDIAIPLYEKFVEELSAQFGKTVLTGKFGSSMLVDIQNDGPVTILMDSRNK